MLTLNVLFHLVHTILKSPVTTVMIVVSGAVNTAHPHSRLVSIVMQVYFHGGFIQEMRDFCAVKDTILCMK